MAGWALPLDSVTESTTDDEQLIPAATVVLLRDTAAGELEVLMLRRNSKIAFGGMWVFPGGRVDDGENDPADPVGSAKRAAVREVEEETGLSIDETSLVSWSYWEPPAMKQMPTTGRRRRFSTWFFACEAPEGEVAIDHGEIHEHQWVTAAQAFDQHRKGDIEIVPPTWITLWQIDQQTSVSSALEWATDTASLDFRTRPIGKRPMVLAWDGDAAYESGDPNQPGPRHRLTMAEDGWIFDHTH